MQTLRVAAVQVTSDNGAIERNLANARPWVEQAAARGARLVLCPEFLAAGYVYDEVIWQSGEPAGGPTERWLRDLATELGVHVGASFLEAEGDDFFNTFTLMAPDGRPAGRVRKRSLPAFEGWFFKPCEGPKVIETELGRIAVGICNDNQTADFLAHLCDERPDLVLMPHSAPTPQIPLLDRLFRHQMSSAASRIARTLGVPTVLCNKVASRPTTSPVPGLPLAKLRWQFQGDSRICDAAGTVLDQLAEREGVVIADIVLDPSRKRTPPPTRAGYWSFPPPLIGAPSGMLARALERMGRAAYQRSRERRRRARGVSRAGE